MRCEVAATFVQVIRDQERAPESVDLRDEAYIKRAAERLPDIGRKARPWQECIITPVAHVDAVW